VREREKGKRERERDGVKERECKENETKGNK
jgi:hypothetical protein